MLAMEVIKNGKRLCVAGAEDLGVLAASFSAGGRLGRDSWEFAGETSKPQMRLHVGGITSRKGEADNHLDWIGQMDIKVGDVVTLKFVEVDEADIPIESRDPRAASSSGGREHFDALKQQYLSSLKKFRK
jgi:hypothetical protein